MCVEIIVVKFYFMKQFNVDSWMMEWLEENNERRRHIKENLICFFLLASPFWLGFTFFFLVVLYRNVIREREKMVGRVIRSDQVSSR